jgi:hypothetical protein
MGSMMQKVRLVHAWCWYCESCGRENFENSIELTLDEALSNGTIDQDTFDEFSEVTDSAIPVMIGAPDVVKCKHCGDSFDIEMD